MRRAFLVAVSTAVLTLAGTPGGAMPMSVAVAPSPAPVLTQVAGGCGPGLVRGRRGTCLVRRAIFSHGRIVRKGCGKPIGAMGQRTPC